MKCSKKLLFVLTFSIFSFQIFSAPSGNHGGAPSGNAPSGNRGGAFSNDSRARPDAAPAPRNPSNGGNRGGASSSKSGVFSGSPTNSKSPETNMFTSNKSAQNQFFQDSVSENSGIIYYRGNRTLVGNEEFTLQNIKTERVNSDTVSLEITFSESVNPRTFTADSILLDGEAISSKTKFSFNKKGDTIKIDVPSQSENFSLMIKDVESFDGTVLEPVTVEIKK